MSSTEKTQYKDLLDECRTKVDMAVSGRRNGKVNSTVLESLLSLRLFCNNGKATTSVPLDSDEALSYLEQLDKNVCIYCSSTIFWLSDTPDTDGGIILAGCRHLVCHSCIPDHRSRQNKCPCCDSDHAQSDWPIPLLDNSKYHHPQTGIGATPRMKQYPTKLLALLSEISQNPAQKWYFSQETHSLSSCWANHLVYFLVSSSQVGKRLSISLPSFSPAMESNTAW